MNNSIRFLKPKKLTCVTWFSSFQISLTPGMIKDKRMLISAALSVCEIKQKNSPLGSSLEGRKKTKVKKANHTFLVIRKITLTMRTP